ncbi:ATP-dependent RNA helicase [Skeletonema marinoi]|uniref:ATP-dependent RNA helicase n=1 Tax=Skeletonema marinoi TaxID=267567 RepID=A0AAD8YLY7_9STRA|nr:ATP-dependent RNA helicase [Skeletonema marinoi]
MSSLFGSSSRKRTAAATAEAPSSITQESSKKKRSSLSSAPTNTSDDDNTSSTSPYHANSSALTTTFSDLGLSAPLVQACRKLGFKTPTGVQRAIIPFILKQPTSSSSSNNNNNNNHHVLTLSATGSGKTAAFALPLLHELSHDPYGIFALILTPTRELAKQIQQQILALGSGSGWKITCALIIGGEDMTKQSLELSRQPNFVVGTPGRLAELCRDGVTGGGHYRPNFRKVKYVVLDEQIDYFLLGVEYYSMRVDEADGTKKRVRRNCRMLLFSATMTRSLKSLEELAGAGVGRLPLKKIVVRSDGTWDSGEVKQKQKDVEEDGDDDDGSSNALDEKSNNKEKNNTAASDEDDDEAMMKIKDPHQTYLQDSDKNTSSCPIAKKDASLNSRGSDWSNTTGENLDISEIIVPLAQSAIIFVPTCERAAHISGILTELGIQNVALHSLLSQNRRLASLGTFQSQQVRVLVATDVASRGLDVPEVDLVVNAELPRRAVDYVHRVGRTARAGRRGRAISLVGEQDVDLVHEAEKISGRKLLKCTEVTEDMAIKALGPVAKASRLTKMKLMDIGFDELVKKHRDRKRRDRRLRMKAEKRARQAMAKISASKN